MNNTINHVMIRLILVGIACIAVSASIKAQSTGPVWKISNDKHSIFIGGTLHILSESDYPLPTVFEKAYKQSDTVVFETDMSQLQTPSAQGALLSSATYQDGSSLQSVLSKEVYTTLADYLTKNGRNIRQFEQFKPGLLSVLLTLNELARLGQLGEGVDAFYDNKALTDNKPRVFLETLEQQISFIADMGNGQEDELILHTLEEIKNLSSSMSELKSAWRSGNNQQLVAVALTPWQDTFPDIYQLLLVQRNNAWLPQLIEMLNTPAIEYVLVGALHLVGKEGLLQQLRSQGYRVEQVN